MEFTKEYQESLLLSLGNPGFAKHLNGFLTADVFSMKLAPVAKDVLDAIHAGQHLSVEQIHQVAARHGQKLVGSGSNSMEYDRLQLEAFVKDRLLKQSLALAQQLREEHRYEEAVVAVRDSLRPVERHHELSNSLLKGEDDVGRQGHVPTGLASVDDRIGGGLCPGELGVLIGPTSVGKTSTLSAFGVSALKSGKSVLQVTLEDSEREVLRKYRRSLLGRADYTFDEWQQAASQFSMQKLHILQCGAWELEVQKIRSYVTPETGIVIVDNADYLKPGKGSSGVKYEDLGHIFVELKNLANQCQVPVWTSSQINRTGYDKVYANIEHVAGSLEKMTVADMVFSLNQDLIQKGTDQEGYSEVSLVCVKNRHGTRFWKVDCRVRFDVCLYEAGMAENV